MLQGKLSNMLRKLHPPESGKSFRKTSRNTEHGGDEANEDNETLHQTCSVWMTTNAVDELGPCNE